MNLSKTSKYALRILGYMAKDETALYSAKQIYQQVKVPDRYLRRLLTDLSKSGLIKSIQGRNGGFMFARNISDIFLYDIINSVSESESFQGCILGYESCAFDYQCPMHSIWEETRLAVINRLSGTSLLDIQQKIQTGQG